MFWYATRNTLLTSLAQISKITALGQPAVRITIDDSGSG
jgi:hypothetical protein